MKWKKLGLVYSPDKNNWWSQHYAMMPTPILLEQKNIIRVFFGTTDSEKFGRTSFIDLNANNPLEIKGFSDSYVLDIGKPGTFDDSGAVPSSIVSIRHQQYLFYVGFQRAYKVPYMLFSGLAVSADCDHFYRYSEAPVIDRSPSNVYSNAAPFVLFDNEENIFKMWYWLGKEWVTINNKLYINAEICYATSLNAIEWNHYKAPCLVPDSKTEFSLGRPWVIKADNRYKMFYSVRYVDKLYRLGYAESFDGLNWTRKDNEIGIDVGEDGWDAEMICYPAVINAGEKTFLFYNGNNNGETGFGVAELILE